MHRWVVFSILTVPCHPVPERFHHSRRKPRAQRRQALLGPPSPGPRQPPANLPSVSVALPIPNTSYKCDRARPFPSGLSHSASRSRGSAALQQRGPRFLPFRGRVVARGGGAVPHFAQCPPGGPGRLPLSACGGLASHCASAFPLTSLSPPPPSQALPTIDSKT